jgi:hypothetical protein
MRSYATLDLCKGGAPSVFSRKGGIMRWRLFVLPLAVGLPLILPTAAQAGMPSVTLTFTDWGAMRLETLSFFAIALLITAAVVRWLWNVLAADFPKLPRLTYKKSLAGVVLIGLALAVVLTMIAGSRELLTPGAWEKDGRLYKLAGTQKSPEVAPPHLEAGKPRADGHKEMPAADGRKANLGRLFAALRDYAAKHDGSFPSKDEVELFDSSLREMPGTAGMHYRYVEGLADKDSGRIIAYEPEFADGKRFVVLVDGTVQAMTTADIRQALKGEEKP